MDRTEFVVRAAAIFEVIMDPNMMAGEVDTSEPVVSEQTASEINVWLEDWRHEQILSGRSQ